MCQLTISTDASSGHSRRNGLVAKHAPFTHFLQTPNWQNLVVAKLACPRITLATISNVHRCGRKLRKHTSVPATNPSHSYLQESAMKTQSGKKIHIKMKLMNMAHCRRMKDAKRDSHTAGLVSHKAARALQSSKAVKGSRRRGASETKGTNPHPRFGRAWGQALTLPSPTTPRVTLKSLNVPLSFTAPEFLSITSTVT